MSGKINIENYEAYYLDYVEGNLSAQDTQSLLDFLEQHPDLQSEIEIFDEDILLQPVQMNTPDFSFLKQTDFEADLIKADNFEDFAIADAEGILTNHKHSEFENYVQDEASLAEKELRVLYQKSVLKPNTNVSFEGKEVLKKPSGILIYFSQTRYWAAAAAILMFVSLAFWLSRNSGEEHGSVQEIAKNTNSEQVEPQVTEESILSEGTQAAVDENLVADSDVNTTSGSEDGQKDESFGSAGQIHNSVADDEETVFVPVTSDENPVADDEADDRDFEEVKIVRKRSLEMMAFVEPGLIFETEEIIQPGGSYTSEDDMKMPENQGPDTFDERLTASADEKQRTSSDSYTILQFLAYKSKQKILKSDDTEGRIKKTDFETIASRITKGNVHIEETTDQKAMLSYTGKMFSFKRSFRN